MCDLYHDHGETTLLRDQWVKARKPHRCDECWRPIAAGQKHGVYAGTFEREFFTVRHCPRCMRARKWLEARGHGWMGDAILEDVRVCVRQEMATGGAG